MYIICIIILYNDCAFLYLRDRARNFDIKHINLNANVAFVAFLSGDFDLHKLKLVSSPHGISHCVWYCRFTTQESLFKSEGIHLTISNTNKWMTLPYFMQQFNASKHTTFSIPGTPMATSHEGPVYSGGQTHVWLVGWQVPLF